jgi:hypothetical protein
MTDPSRSTAFTKPAVHAGSWFESPADFQRSSNWRGDGIPGAPRFTSRQRRRNPNCAVVDYTEMELTGTGKNCNLKWRRQRGNG